jgi:hypothetical protein
LLLGTKDLFMALLGKRDEEEYIIFSLDIGEGLLIFYLPSLKNGRRGGG